MKQVLAVLLASFYIASCDNAENDKRKTQTLPGITTMSENTSNSVATVLQAQIDWALTHFEATKLKNEPERALPLYERAREIKKHGHELEEYMNDVKKMISGQTTADFEKTKTALFNHIDETVSNIGNLLNQEEKSKSRNHLDVKEKAAFDQDNAVAMINLLQIDLKCTELDAIKAILPNPAY